VVLVDVSDFPTGSNVGTITFGEFNSGTQNPVYLPSDYGLGDNPNAPNVSFGGFFVGQSLPNTAVPAVDGNATSPLTLDPEALATIVKNDATLGSTVGIGPIALLLSHPVPALQVSHMLGIQRARRQLTGSHLAGMRLTLSVLNQMV
jgi:hypothetical protein